MQLGSNDNSTMCSVRPAATQSSSSWLGGLWNRTVGILSPVFSWMSWGYSWLNLANFIFGVVKSLIYRAAQCVKDLQQRRYFKASKRAALFTTDGLAAYGIMFGYFKILELLWESIARRAMGNNRVLADSVFFLCMSALQRIYIQFISPYVSDAYRAFVHKFFAKIELKDVEQRCQEISTILDDFANSQQLPLDKLKSLSEEMEAELEDVLCSELDAQPGYVPKGLVTREPIVPDYAQMKTLFETQIKRLNALKKESQKKIT